MALYKLSNTGVHHEDGRNISGSLDNRDWREFLEWQAAGNTPDPQDPDPPPTQDQIDAIAAKTDIEVQALANLTPAQARARVALNVTNLADAKILLGHFAAILCVLARRL